MLRYHLGAHCRVTRDGETSGRSLGPTCLRSPIISLSAAISGKRATSVAAAIRMAVRRLRDAFKKELSAAGLGPLVRANHAGCLEQCEHGPTVVIYPLGVWYGHVTIADVPRIVAKTILGGEIINDLVIPDHCLNNPDCPHRGGTARRESRG